MGKAAQQKSAKIRTRNHLQSSQQFKGIRQRKWGKWVSEVRKPNSRERIWLGSYDSPEQAARAYDAAVYCLRGLKATLNFPDNPPEIPSASSLSPGEIQTAAARFALDGFPSPSPSVNNGAEPLSPSPLGSSSSSSPSEYPIEWKFWESLLADSQTNKCSNRLDMLMFDLPFHSSSLEDGGFTFDQTDLWTF